MVTCVEGPNRLVLVGRGERSSLEYTAARLRHAYDVESAGCVQSQEAVR